MRMHLAWIEWPQKNPLVGSNAEGFCVLGAVDAAVISLHCWLVLQSRDRWSACLLGDFLIKLLQITLPRILVPEHRLPDRSAVKAYCIRKQKLGGAICVETTRICSACSTLLLQSTCLPCLFEMGESHPYGPGDAFLNPLFFFACFGDGWIQVPLTVACSTRSTCLCTQLCKGQQQARLAHSHWFGCCCCSHKVGSPACTPPQAGTGNSASAKFAG